MKLTADYHTHTVYSDGKSTVLENALRAEEIGLSAIAITEHGYSHRCRGIKRKETKKWLNEIEEARSRVSIPVLAGMECNIRGVSGLVDLTPDDYENFDVFLAGIHIFIRYERTSDTKLGWRGWIKHGFHTKPSRAYIDYTTRAYINAIEKNPVDILTHLNYLAFADAVEVAKCCRDHGTYLELNSKKQHLSDEELFAVAQTGVRFVIDSDAHSPSRIGDTKLVEEQLARVEFPLDRIDNIDGRTPSFRFAEYKKHL